MQGFYFNIALFNNITYIGIVNLIQDLLDKNLLTECSSEELSCLYGAALCAQQQGDSLILQNVAALATLVYLNQDQNFSCGQTKHEFVNDTGSDIIINLLELVTRSPNIEDLAINWVHVLNTSQDSSVVLELRMNGSGAFDNIVELPVNASDDWGVENRAKPASDFELTIPPGGTAKFSWTYFDQCGEENR